MYTNHDMVTGAWRTAKGWCGTAVGGLMMVKVAVALVAVVMVVAVLKVAAAGA